MPRARAANGGEGELAIRDARRADLTDLVALLADDELGSRREVPGAPLDPAYLTALEAIDRDPRHRLVVLTCDEQVVGCLQLSLLPYLSFRGGWRAQIEAVRIASEWRGGGFGRRLLTWAIAEAEREGCHLVQLTTNVERAEAAALYRSLGFEPTHTGMKRYLTGDATGR